MTNDLPETVARYGHPLPRDATALPSEPGVNDVRPQTNDSHAELRAAEEWFHRQGLPWFVDAVDERVRDLLGRRRLWLLVAGVMAAAGLTGWLAQREFDDWPTTAMLGSAVALTLLLSYAGGPLRVGVMARWAARRVVTEFDLLFSLVTRALPLLLLFMTFSFISTEIWQVTSALDRPTLYAVVLLFAGLGVAFLLTRLPQEVRRVQRSAAGDGVARACLGTPLERQAQVLARRSAAGGADEPIDETLSRTQRANLILVLLVTQSLQVMLLSAAVFAFFIGFGLLAVRASVLQSWLGHPPTPIAWTFGQVTVHLPVSVELYQVSVFLSAFAGFYFTVYAMSDSNYRAQFFEELSHGLEQAIGVRAVYRILLAESEVSD
jgi:hypothetical protein